METQQNSNYTYPQDLPGSTTVLVLGIISIVFCGIIGLVCGVIALVKSGKDKILLYEQNPGVYSSGSYNNLKAGRICAIIGVSLSAVAFLFMVAYIAVIVSFFGALFGSGY